MSLLSRLAVSAARAYGALSSNPNAVSTSYLVVAGGGGGGFNQAGGGGAGGLLTSTATLSTLTTYTVTVGAGGAGGTSGISGSVGGNSVLSGTSLITVTSTGGGGGGTYNVVATSGGSGGGGAGATINNTGGTGTSGQGFAGGTSTNNNAAGGGGAGGVGATGAAFSGGAGGTGVASSISGASVNYAGGGGGGNAQNSGSGGTATFGGGAGGTNAIGTAGTVNLGGGGGGGGNNGVNGFVGGQGGSGVVIIAYTSATPRFVGGTLTTSGGNQIHTFTSSGTLSPLTPVTASYLVVAGGAGGGGGFDGGGGGAGGLLTSSTTIYSGATYVVTVGAGGAGGVTATGTSGVASSISGTGLTTITSTGGGGGGGGGGAVGLTGGSGGGGSRGNAGGTGTSGQGFAGGTGIASTPTVGAGGGGGGASAVGANSTSGAGGNGGVGTASSISGTSTYYAGGGGGSTRLGSTNGTGGSGGGGAGVIASTGETGTTNTGGGGGASGQTNGGSGGSGTVIISYAGSQVFNGGLVTSSGGNTIHTFNATGALTPVTNNLNNSLRFRSSASARLTRTPTIAGNQKTWTWSAWVKRGSLSSTQTIFGAYPTDGFSFRFVSDDTLRIYDYTGAYNVNLITTQVFRDPSAWYHLSLVMDTTQATAANRVKLYVNGNQVTAFGTATYPTQNANLLVNSVTAHDIGRDSYAASYFDGYLTDINFIDGQALEPYYFGNNDAYGNWKPILYKGMYGTNGFYLTFADTSALTTTSNAGLGKDTSGNGNYWATNNISITAGVTYDAMLDVPTNTSATVANYAVANPLDKSTNVTVTNGNLTVSTAVTNAGIRGSMYVSSGKYYWEATCTTKTNYPNLGIADAAWGLTNVGSTSGSYGYATDALKYNNGSSTAYGATYTTGDVIGVALDLDAGTLVFYKNNASQGTAYSSLSGTFAPAFAGQASDVWNVNFGQRPFTYTAPSGYVALNTYNLPTPTILQGNKYMDATLYTGTGASQSITNAGAFKPDLVWGKARSTTRFNVLVDSIRGSSKDLYSNSTSAEYTDANVISSINSNGFSLGTDAELNLSANTFVAWQWQAGQGTTSSNTSGSITSTVSVNATAGFSIVSFTTVASTNSTVGHGLGVAPKMIIVRYRSATSSWFIWHTSLTSGSYYVALDSTAAQASIPTLWNSTIPTSSVFSLGTAWTTSAASIAYCFAEIAGFSKFGSYTGNNSTDGPFVYLGFRPKFIMIKDATNVQSWNIIDSARVTYNVDNMGLYPNLTNAESANLGLDLLSNGFKFRTDGTTNGNASGATYIFMAFAESPFKNSNAR